MNPLRPLPPSAFGAEQARHLLRRAGFGAPPDEVARLVSIGLDAAVDRLLAFDAIPDLPDPEDRFDSGIIRPPTAEERRIQQEARRSGDQETLERLGQERQRRQMEDRRQMGSIRGWWLRRLIGTPRPLQERLVLFWHGHFTSGFREIGDSYLLHQQNRLFRRLAAGPFDALLREVLRDPAMLRYLDSDRNVARAPNENLARELLELFTLGEGRGYGERDIREAARALTGLGVEDHTFRFDRRNHDDGVKLILGRRGAFDADGLATLLLEQRAASEHLAARLHRFFVRDEPSGDPGSQQAILAMAALLRRHGWRLPPVLRALFTSAHFYAPANRAAIIRRPIDLVVSTIRTLGTPPRSTDVLLSALEQMGEIPFQPPTVQGWPGGRLWINTSTLPLRQNLAVYLLTGRVPAGVRGRADGSVFDADRFRERAAIAADAPPSEIAERVLGACLPTPPHPRRIEAAAAAIAGVPPRDRLVALLCFATALPEYQLV